jgi:thiol-disulfide isomerase/thioredoxin
VIKKWCRLCIITSGLLWLQFFILLPQATVLVKQELGSAVFINAIPVLFVLFINAVAWFWLKPLLKKNKELETEKFALQRFKNNPEVFSALLEKQKKLTVNPDGLGIVLGNPQAENTIIKVCNPYCGPCAKAHPVMEELLMENKNLKVQILFTANDDANDQKAKPVKHLMALYEKKDDLLMTKALDDWYLAEKKDYEVFADKYRLNGELECQGEKLKAMRRWCDEVKIEHTPTFFINGYQLPKQYNIEDVKYFLQK